MISLNKHSLMLIMSQAPVPLLTQWETAVKKTKFLCLPIILMGKMT